MLPLPLARRPSIPGPSNRYPGALLVAFRRDPLGFLTRLAREYGDVAQARFGRQRVVLLSHPDYVRDVLVTEHRRFHKGIGLQRAKALLGEGLLTSEGEFHRRQRRLAQPAFHAQRIAAYGATMAAYAERAAERWVRLADAAGGGPLLLDVHAEMMRLTLGIVGRTLFGADIEGEAEEIGRAVATSLGVFRSFTTLPFYSLLERLPLPATRRFAAARRRLDATVYRLIAERRADAAGRDDLLSMLLLAQDEESSGAGMTDEQLRDEALTLLLAGHETTANALSWTWYLLAQHPEVERRLHAEIAEAVGTSAVTAGDLSRLPYAWRVLAESMRLYPPAWVIGRLAVADHEVAGYRIPVGAVVLLSQWVVQRDPRFFEEPERFEPDRWTEDARAARPRFSYFPFGGGPRICIGEQFAWMEGVLLLATIARRWRLRLAPDRPIVLQPSVTLRPKSGLWMTAETR
jgi:cytochrome P450